MGRKLLVHLRWLLPLGLTALIGANAAPALDVVAVDLAPLIERAAGRRAQFAVDVPHRVSTDTHGAWVSTGDRQVWVYTVRLPGAVSLSFHASRVALPTGAFLTVTAGNERFEYLPANIVRSGLWSRPALGDTLTLQLSVPAVARDGVAFEIASLQAGFRGLSPGVRNHPHFDAVLQDKTGHASDGAVVRDAPGPVPGTACVENVDCHRQSANEPAVASTVALIIQNLAQCTGTLINDVAGSGTPYVLTARHCQDGSDPGGNPQAARNTWVYWNAVSTCGQPLSSIYAAATGSQFGATTVVEQADTWLIRLDALPVSPDAGYAGWDVTGGSFVGGFSVHHAVGLAQQYTEWFGQPLLATRDAGAYLADVWRVTNSLGNVGFGASGGALFDPAGRVVGVSSRAAFLEDDLTGYSICPSAPPAAPTPTTWTVEFNALAALWDSNTDTTSTTNPATYRAVLDPQGTGTLVVDPLPPAPPVALTASGGPSLLIGESQLVLSWQSSEGAQCVASGGGPASGWSGPRPPSGSFTVTEQAAGYYDYTITCTRGGRERSASQSRYWSVPAPRTGLTSTGYGETLFVGQDVTLSWNSNVGDCIASDGVPGDGWAGSKPAAGTQVVRSDAPATAIYRLTCGQDELAVTGVEILTWWEVQAHLGVVGGPSRMRVGQTIRIQQNSFASSCVGSGGMPGDGWAGQRPLSDSFKVTGTTAGTYTYILECSGGDRVATAQLDITFTDEAPTAEIVATPARPFLQTRHDYTSLVELSWVANVAPCALGYSGPQSGSIPLPADLAKASGTMRDLRELPGLYTYTVTCGSGDDQAIGTTTVDWQWPPASVTMTAFSQDGSPTPYYLPGSIAIEWQSNVPECDLSGGGPGDGWQGTALPPYFGMAVQPQQPGAYTYTVTCGPPGNRDTTELTLEVLAKPAPVIDNFFTSRPIAQPGAPSDLSWHVRFADSCTASGGVANDGWSGPKDPRAGYQNVRSLQAGPVTYTLSCANEVGSTVAHVVVSYEGEPLPSVLMIADPASAVAGTPVLVTWTSTGVSACYGYGGLPSGTWNGSKPANGSETLTFPTPGSYFLGLNCDNGKAYGDVRLEVKTPAQPMLDFRAEPEVLEVGSTLGLTWNSGGATDCIASGGAPEMDLAGPVWSGSVGTNGARYVRPAAAGRYPYTLTCSAAGSAVFETVHVTVTAAPAPPPLPVATLSASVASTTTGQTFTLSWSSTDATSCTASGGATGDGWTGAIALSGTLGISAGAAGRYTYAIACTGPGGTAQAHADVTVNSPPPPPGGGGGGAVAGSGGGGGGGLGIGSLGLLALLAISRRRHAPSSFRRDRRWPCAGPYPGAMPGSASPER